MTLLFAVGQADVGARLGHYLRRQGVAMSLLRSVKYLPDGLLVNGSRAKTNLALQLGDVVAFTLPPEGVFSVLPQEMGLEIVYESPHVLVVNKPAGLVVHPTYGHPAGTLANGVCGLVQARGLAGYTFRPVGRLDGNTSGPVLCAMNEFAAPLLAKSLAKSYLALVYGRLEGAGTIDAPLGPAGESLTRQCVRGDGKQSVTHYEVLAASGVATLLRVKPLTGRTHQIRAHFSHIGHPLHGDGLYGGPDGLIGRHALHCEAVAFCEPFVKLQNHTGTHQTGGSVRVECPPPADFVAALQAARLDKASTKLYNASNRVLLS